MKIDAVTAAGRLAATAEVVRNLTNGVPDSQARWKPAPEQWSVLEVVNHLADEEVEDFRTRLHLVLHDPDAPWPPIDPQGWVVRREYQARDPAQSLQRFLRERGRSIDWLTTLDGSDWSRSHLHPHAGRLSAGTLLACWLAHDLLHVRQLTRLHYRYLAKQVEPHSLEYAGSW